MNARTQWPLTYRLFCIFQVISIIKTKYLKIALVHSISQKKQFLNCSNEVGIQISGVFLFFFLI